LQPRPDRLEGPGGEGGQGLARSHEVEILVRLDVEQAEDLVQQGPVLGGDADLRLEPRQIPAGRDDRGQLDGLGPGPEHEPDALWPRIRRGPSVAVPVAVSVGREMAVSAGPAVTVSVPVAAGR